MVERRPLLDVLSHGVLLVGVLVVAFPVYLTFVASTHTAQEIIQAPMPLLPGDQFLHNYAAVLTGSERGPGSGAPVGRMMWVSLVSALVIAIGKIAISLLSAFAIVYFRFPFKQVVFWMIFVTLMLPVEVRIFPTYQVISYLGMLNSYAGLTIPLIASATATFLFRQFFMTVPDELVEAARVDVAESGTRTSLKKRIGPAPSTRAASTSSSGTVMKNWRNRKVAVAEAMSGMVSPA